MSRRKHRNIQNFFRSGDIDKYEYLPWEEILPCDQSRIIEQAKFTYFPLDKAFEKKKKNDWRARKKPNKGTRRAWKKLIMSKGEKKRFLKDLFMKRMK